MQLRTHSAKLRHLPLGGKLGFDMEKDDPGRNIEDDEGVTYKEGLCRKDLKHFQDYVESTTTHGVVRVFGGNATYLKRFVWLVIFLASFSGLLAIFVNRAQRLRSSPKSTTLEYTQASTIPLPAVTVCNQNPLKVTYLEREGLLDFFDCWLGTPNNTVRSCAGLLPEMAARRPLVDILSDGGQSEQELLQLCLFHNDTCDGRGISVRRVFVNSRLCYTVNSDLNPALSITNPQQALYLYLNLNNSAFTGLATDFGASVIIHSPGVPPSLEMAIRVPAGFRAFITLSVQKQQLLEPVYGKCTRFRNLEYYPGIYNVPACIRNEEFRSVAENCRCLHPEATGQNPSGLPKCNLTQLDCVFVYSDTSNAPISNICPVVCNSVLYQPTVSYTVTPEFRAPASENNMSVASYGNSQVQIQLGSLRTLTITENAAYELGDFFSDIGGNMGLFLGASVISLFEFIMLISDELMDRVLQVWRLKKLIVGKLTVCKHFSSQTDKMDAEKDFQAFKGAERS